MISITPAANTAKTLTKIMILPQSTEMALTHGWQESGRLVTQELRTILSTGPRTGRVYTIRGRKHQASAPGEPPGRLTGRLVDSVRYEATGSHTLEVGEDAEYAAWLENGTRRMAPRPHLKVAVDKSQTRVMDTLIRYLNEIYR